MLKNNVHEGEKEEKQLARHILTVLKLGKSLKFHASVKGSNSTYITGLLRIKKKGVIIVPTSQGYY